MAVKKRRAEVVVEVEVVLTRAGQVASAKAGRSAAARQIIEFDDPSSDRWAELVDAATVDDAGRLLITVERPLDSLPATIDDVFAAIAAEVEAARQGELDRVVVFLDSLDDEEHSLPEIRALLAGVAADEASVGSEQILVMADAAREAVWRVQAGRETTEWLAGLDQEAMVLPEVRLVEEALKKGEIEDVPWDIDGNLNARATWLGRDRPRGEMCTRGLDQAMRAVWVQRLAAEEAGRRAEDEAWVAAHGSDRLRRIVAEGFLDDSAALLRDERLAHDRPGWQWLTDGAVNEAVTAPTEEALDLLAEARLVDPEAKLVVRSRSVVAVGHYAGSEIGLYPPSQRRG